MPYCPSCGKEVGEDVVFCPNCGRALKQAPALPVMPPGQGMYDPDISTARTLTLVAIILQLVFFVIGLVVVSSVLAFMSSSATGFTFPAFGLFGAVFGFAFVISFIWIALDYFLVYKNLDSPNTTASARTPALVLGIIQLLFSVIPGILLIVAYVKIGDSMTRRGQRY